LSSVSFNVLAALVISVVVQIASLDAPDLTRLAAKDETYLRQHWVGTAGWLLLLIATACLCAAVWAGLLNRTNRFAELFSKRPLRWLLSSDGGTEYVSAWWKLLIDPSVHPTLDRYLTCNLDDGSSVSGWLYSANHEAKEGPDRELTLSAPLVIRDKLGVKKTVSVGAASISSSRLVWLLVRYADRDLGAVPADEDP
jgi:hypothetical protein